MDTTSLTAHDQIRQVAARYSRGVDRLDLATMQSAYWPDAIDDHGVYVGDAMVFCERVVSSHARFESTMHCVLNHWIDVIDDGAAHGEVYNVTYLRSIVDGTPVLDTWWGRYVDRYECRGGEWRIIHRVCVHEATERRDVTTTMPIDSAAFRQGHEDRGGGA
jgi:SnoaL-like domain